MSNKSAAAVQSDALALLSASTAVSARVQRMRAEVAALVPALRDQSEAAERQRYVTHDISQRLGEIGVFDLGTPQEYGGLAAGARELVEILREVGRGDGSAGWLATTAANNHLLMAAYPEQAVKDVFGSGVTARGPRLVGASFFARKVGSARRTQDGWMVRGRWGFASGCRTADWGIVGVDLEGEGVTGRGLALLPREHYEIVDDWHTAGMAATASNTIITKEEVFVPEHRLFNLAEMPSRMSALRDRYSGRAFSWQDQSRMVVLTMNLAAVALGIGEGALECFQDMAPKRTPFNLPYATIADCPASQMGVGRARAQLDMARVTVECVADGVDRASENGLDFTASEATRLHMTLVMCIRQCVQAVAELEEALGTSAFALNNPIQRYHRDIRTLASHGAIRFDPLSEISGRDALGLPPHPMFAGGLPDTDKPKTTAQ
jgi:alkylation response protein AidB-like acyl-CoA dehydrogenase